MHLPDIASPVKGASNMLVSYFAFQVCGDCMRKICIEVPDTLCAQNDPQLHQHLYHLRSLSCQLLRDCCLFVSAESAASSCAACADPAVHATPQSNVCRRRQHLAHIQARSGAIR